MNKLIPFLIGFLLGLFFVKTAFAHKIVIRYTVKSGGKQFSNISPKKSAPRLTSGNSPKTSTLVASSLDLSNDNAKTVSYTALTSDQEYVIGLIKLYFGNDWKIAYAVARAESGLVCDKRSYQMNSDGTYDHGLFQINDIHKKNYPDANLYDCEVNVRIASNIYNSWQGFHAWSAYNNGSYYKFYQEL